MSKEMMSSRGRADQLNRTCQPTNHSSETLTSLQPKTGANLEPRNKGKKQVLHLKQEKDVHSKYGRVVVFKTFR
jgi:hypothetical protein